MNKTFDVIIAGAGLAGGLLAHHLRQTRPEWDVFVVEKGKTLGGNHTWSFHETDVTKSSLTWLHDLLAKSWTGYDVRFPKYARTLPSGYFSIRSAKFHEVLSRSLENRFRLDSTITQIDAEGVTLDEGTRLSAKLVIDARGASAKDFGRVGYQKFFGLDLELSRPHGLRHPLLMDAMCEQLEGYRFFYVLPWTPTTLLIEDTRYSDTPHVDKEVYREEILAYARRKGWRVAKTVGEEMGSLPIPLSRFPSAPPLTIGMKAGLFHLTTGYSLPEAVSTAELIAKCPLDRDKIATRLSRQIEDVSSRRKFYSFLNRMLFLGAEPAKRYRILERFYTLDDSLIHRFYRMRLTGWDRARILWGRPPISVSAAIRCIPELEAAFA